MTPRSLTDLDAAASEIVRRLGGIWQPSGAMCRCPAHDDRTPSLSVRIGERSLLFKCFAGCSVVDIFRALRRLGLDLPARNLAPSASAGHDHRWRHRVLATKLWERASDIRGTPGERYLAARGISDIYLPLRFHPRTPIGSGREVGFRPALIAPLQDENELTAVQRIFLDASSPRLAPDLRRARLMLGRPMGGAVRLAAPGATLGLAEGVETAAAAMLLLAIPVWATLGSGRFARIAVPNFVEHLILLPDADRPGLAAARLAASEYARPGRIIETLLPPGGVNDWNEVLGGRRNRKGERGGGMRQTV